MQHHIEDVSSLLDTHIPVALVQAELLHAGITSPEASIVGTSGNDTLAGTETSDTISGSYGDDLVNGLGGDDTIYGGSSSVTYNDGNDSLNGGSGDDFLVGGSGSNHIDGGSGEDTVSLHANTGSNPAYGVTANYSSYDASKGGNVDNLQGGVDHLTSVESIDVTGTEAADTIIGSSGHNIINGGDGSDLLVGGGGDDILEMNNAGNSTLLGGHGNDRIYVYGLEDSSHLVVDGGNGHDVLQIDDFGQEVRGATTSWNGDTLTVTASDGSYTVTATNIEQIQINTQGGESSLIGGAGDDNLSGDGYLNGGKGDDYLDGSGTLIGGGGNDTVFGGSGADNLNGSSGYNLYGIDVQTGFNVHSVDASGFDTAGGAHTVDYGVGQDSIVGFEAVDITDGYSNETLIGSAGNDIITNGYGADSIEGGAGDDVIQQTLTTAYPPGGSYSDGNDTLDGGAGRDTLSFADTTYLSGSFGYHVDLSTGLVTSIATGTDTISGFEHVIGWEGSDTMIGSASGDMLDGGYGGDSLSGGLGRDTLIGGQGDDTLSGGKGHDVLIAGAGNDQLSGGGGADVFRFTQDVLSSPGSSARIRDLTNIDRIDVSRIDADATVHGNQAFHLVDAFSDHAGELTMSYDAARDLTIIAGDVNGDGSADLLIRINGDHTDFHNLVL